ncbi:MAG: GIY-YIG nuclease family protein [bacterium]
MYYVYLLKLKNNKIYTGSTPNLDERLQEHKEGKCKSTKNLLPFKLLWFCAFPSRLIARRFENYLKKGSGQAFRDKHLL